MFNKKLFFFLIFILFIFQVSFVNAHECNETMLLNETDDVMKYQEVTSYNNEKNVDFNELDDKENSEKGMTFNQGDKIPIHINSFVDGDLIVLVDNKRSGEIQNQQ